MTQIKMGKTSLTLFGLSLVILLVNLSSCNQGKENKQGADSANLIEVHENNLTVSSYVTFVAADENKMSLDHSYTNEALLKLADATKAMANEVGYDVQNDLSKVTTYAEEIRKDPLETTHADDVRKAADILTNELEGMQKAKYPGLDREASELKDASVAIKPEILTLEQKDEVKSFFEKAAKLLEKMN